MSIYTEISDNFIKTVLRTYKQRLEEIHKRILELYEEMQDTDSMIRSMSISSKPGKIGGGKTNSQDLGDFLIRHHKMLKQKNEELRAELWRLSEEEETMNRVWICFRALEGKEQKYLQHMYVEGRTYKETELESGLSHKRFETIRGSGIKRIHELYQSKWTNQNIVGMQKKTMPTKKEKKQSLKYEQLTLNL